MTFNHNLFQQLYANNDEEDINHKKKKRVDSP